ncbi:DUF2017 family protein [Naasia sp. SYSU D00948]|uniref:DUF2017 family protein n=1 Tax=Naasia sp. SYSU D00948 TaxID=2817379 RepID=UPI001B30F260|nr:DUF2017 family protein [Naasia sp. SYSU D00948]
MSGFAPAGDGVQRTFRPWERRLLQDLCGDLTVLLGAADQAPGDRALLRLLPTAYPEDREAAREFSSFARPRLTRVKVESAEAMLEDLGSPDPVRLPPERVALWLRGLTDLRLVLAERSAVDPDPALREISDWLGWLLSDLLDVLDGSEQDLAEPSSE